MGDFRITIDAVGGHGCQRNVQAGGAVGRCENEHCPDCKARAFVADLKRSNNVSKAQLVHWPANGERRPDGTIASPEDDLLASVRVVPFSSALAPTQ